MEKIKKLKEGDLLEIINNQSNPGPIHKFNTGDIIKVLAFDTDDWHGDRLCALCKLASGEGRLEYVYEGDFKRVT